MSKKVGKKSGKKAGNRNRVGKKILEGDSAIEDVAILIEKGTDKICGFLDFLASCGEPSK